MRYLLPITLLMTILLTSPASATAEKYPTRFLGFPVDGPKQTMIDSLISRGFVYHQNEDYLTGVYFGEPVYIFLNTRDGRLNRVVVYDITQRDSAEVKKRFNQVYLRFVNNKNYAYMSGKKGKISINEDISISISQYSNNFKAVYGQKKKTPQDSADVQRRALRPTDITQEDITRMSASLKQRLRRIHGKA